MKLSDANIEDTPLEPSLDPPPVQHQQVDEPDEHDIARFEGEGGPSRD